MPCNPWLLYFYLVFYNLNQILTSNSHHHSYCIFLCLHQLLHVSFTLYINFPLLMAKWFIFRITPIKASCSLTCVSESQLFFLLLQRKYWVEKILTIITEGYNILFWGFFLSSHNLKCKFLFVTFCIWLSFVLSLITVILFPLVWLN